MGQSSECASLQGSVHAWVKPAVALLSVWELQAQGLTKDTVSGMTL